MCDLGEYIGYHGYVSIALCVIGIITNIVNIYIWSSVKEKSAVNLLLRMLSILNLCVVMTYLVFVTYTFVMTGPSQARHHDEIGVYVMLVSYHAFIVSLVLSSWTVILLASFRFISVYSRLNSTRTCSVSGAVISIVVTYILSLVVCSVNFLYYYVYNCEEATPSNSSAAHNCSGFWLRKTNFVTDGKFYQTTFFWIFGSFRGLVPSVAFCVLCIGMVIYLIKLSRRGYVNEDAKEYYRKTVGLFVILLLFTLTVVPAVAYDIVMVYRDKNNTQFFFFMDDSGNCINLLAIAELFCSSVDIVIYIPMSKSFRHELCKLFTCSCSRHNDYTAIVTNIEDTEQMQVAKEIDILFD